MMIRVASVGGLFVLALVGSMACDVREQEQEPRAVELHQVEAALSAEICDRMFSCRCDQWRSYDQIDECEQDAAMVALELEMVPERYSGMTLSYDPACMGELIDVYAEVGCSPTIPAEQSHCVPPCHYYHGTKQVGQACELYGIGVSDCAQGLRCSGDVCTNPCANELPDEELPGEGEVCLGNACAGELVCNFEDDRCIALPRAGEPCQPGFGCAEDLFCEALDLSDPMSERQCFEPQEFAAPCRGHAQCQSGYCPAGFCEHRPREGEACAGLCETGLDCVDQVCQLADAAICGAYMPNI